MTKHVGDALVTEKSPRIKGESRLFSGRNQTFFAFYLAEKKSFSYSELPAVLIAFFKKKTTVTLLVIILVCETAAFPPALDPKQGPQRILVNHLSLLPSAHRIQP